MKKLKFIAAALLAAVLLTQTAAGAEQGVRLPIVMYHHVSTQPFRYNDYVVSTEELRSDLEYLKKNGWQSVSVAQLLDYCSGEFEMPEKPFMITFDDGFESTLYYAEPLLEEYGFCGVVAVIGSVCEKFSQLDEHYPEVSHLSWEDASQMAARGVIEVQCHTWDMHSMYPRRGCCKKKGESAESYAELLAADIGAFLSAGEKNGLELTPSIAYPYGAYCEESTQMVRALGFLAAFTCDEKINVLTGDAQELYHLGRFNRPHGPASEKFFAKWEENH